MQQRWTCIGRDDEIATLARVVDPRRGPHAALVVGEPGVGKTRMLEECVGIARALDRPTTMVRARRGISTVPGGAFLGALPTAPPSGDPPTVVWWLRNTLARGGAHPLVIVDDAHVADPVSLAVVAHLLETRAAAVILGARRSEVWPDDLVSFATTPGVERIRLAPLSAADTACLTAKIAGTNVPADNVAEVHRLTGGLPLAVRELVRASEEAGNPVAAGGWRWDAELARDPGIAGLVRSRLATAPEGLRGVVRVVVACGGSAPGDLCVALTSAVAVEEALRRELVTTEDGWLTWSHALVGEVVVATEPLAGLGRIRHAALTVLAGQTSLDARRILLRGELELAGAEPGTDAQVAAAEAALTLGWVDRAAVHAEAALGADPESSAALVVLAIARMGPDPVADVARIGQALSAASDPEARLVAVARCVRRVIDLGGDVESILDGLALITDGTAEPRLLHRIHHLRLMHLAAADPVAFFPAAREFLADPAVGAGERMGVEGFLGLMFAVMGRVDEALDHSGRASDAWRDGLDAHDVIGGWYAGGLARLFSGRGSEAKAIVERGSDLALPHTTGRREWLVVRSLRWSMHAPLGWVGSEMPSLVPVADEVGSIRYGYMIRLQAAWELALRADPAAGVMFAEVEDAPQRLRQGPAFFEALVRVALAAACDGQEAAAVLALRLADEMVDAPPVRAWLLHDAARHGRPASVVADLDELAGAGSDPFPVMLAGSARAMAAEDPDALAARAAEFGSAGFGLFAAENDALAASVLRRCGRSSDAARATVRSLTGREAVGGPTTPILRDLEPHPLTPRQREICRLASTGLKNAEIARLLDLSRRTVENQLHRAYGVLGVDREGLRGIPL